jgi:DNA uptake protein ComE-like DNA-binding protein
MGLTGLVFQELRFSSAILRVNSSLPIARAALKAASYERAADATSGYDTNSELTEEKSVVLCGNNSYKYYFTDKLNKEGSEEVIDEGALININLASVDILQRLPGLDESLADKIANSGLRPYASINELFLVEGLTGEKFQLFKNMVTVYGNGKININTVSKAVLVCLGMDEDLAGIIINFRKEHKIEPAKDIEGNPVSVIEEYGFSSLSSMIADLREYSSLSLRQEQDLIALKNYLDVRSEYLRLNIIPQVGNKPGTHYSVVINPSRKKVVSWREY